MPATIRRGDYRKPVVVEDFDDYKDEIPAYSPWWRGFPEGTYTTFGLSNMLEPAVEDMNAAMRTASGSRYCHLPYNFGGLLGIPACPTRNIITVSPKRKQVERTARLAGWLTAAAKMPGMVKILQRITTGKGINSPYHHWDPIQMVESLRSPGRANRVFWKVRAIANDLLRPYGLQVTWHEVARSICKSPRRHNKAARAAAAATIAGHIWRICQEPIWNRQTMRPWQVLRAAIGMSELKNVSQATANWAVTNVVEGNFATIREALSHRDRLRPITFHQYMIGTLTGIIDDASCVVDGNVTARRFYVASNDKRAWVSHGWQIQSHGREEYNGWQTSYQSAIKEAFDNWGQKISA